MSSVLPSDANATRADADPAAIAATLACAMRAGDRGAFAELHGRFARPLRALLLMHAAARDVDDLLQESFLAAWREREALREPSLFGAWLFAIGRSVARQARRRWTLPRASAEDGLEQVAAPGGEQAAQRAVEGAEVLAALQSLPESYRETLALRLVEGLSGPEIAALTGLTHGSVRVNLHRGMELLRGRLGARRRAAGGDGVADRVSREEG